MGTAKCALFGDRRENKKEACQFGGSDRSSGSIWQRFDAPFKVHLSRYSESAILFPCTFEIFTAL